MFRGLTFSGKLPGGFHSYIYCFCDKDVYVLKISGDLGNFSGS